MTNKDPDVEYFEDWQNKRDIFACCSFIKAGWQMSVGDGKLQQNRQEAAKYLIWKLANWDPNGGCGYSSANTSYDECVKSLIKATLAVYEENPEGM